MRAVLAVMLLMAVASCSSSGSTRATPTSSSTATTTTAPTTTTSKTKFLQVWERELTAASPRKKCQSADAFTSQCVLALENFATTIEKLAKTVAVDGAKYLDTGLTALEVRDAARTWNEQCVTEPPEVRGKRGCLQALFKAINGDEAIISEIYEAEQTR
ncbi:hypothetical protein [Lentzea cavernae]|uniref:Pectinesterase inhibitor domain-containing protein n=1 Tax=Lentzea cavernae TaxID=2020703 RepID=A0ABQ3LXA3_9PSEU|nr:hypothetical protein [Lentzea cavernae]GHH28455.1 hypothetical protein GCM10017774_02690 [Lentzea cavernae]